MRDGAHQESAGPLGPEGVSCFWNPAKVPARGCSVEREKRTKQSGVQSTVGETKDPLGQEALP